MVNSRNFTLAPMLPCTHAQKAPLHKFPDTCDLLFKINSKINLETKVTGWLPPPVVEVQVGERSMRLKRH